MIAQGETLRLILFYFQRYTTDFPYMCFIFTIGIDEINCLQVSHYRFKRGIETFYSSQVAK